MGGGGEGRECFQLWAQRESLATCTAGASAVPGPLACIGILPPKKKQFDGGDGRGGVTCHWPQGADDCV